MISSFQTFNFYRTIIILVCIAAGVSLWMHEFISADTIPKLLSLHPSQPAAPSSPSTMNLSDVLFPVPFTAGHSPLTTENHMRLHAMFSCIERGDCHQNQTKVVILASQYFRDWYKMESRGGESIWAKSTMLALANLGYTYIVTPYPSLLHAIHYHEMFPDLVKFVFMDSVDASGCFEDNGCTSSEQNSIGIPPWKVFSFSYWSGSHNPLGLRWTLSPEDYANRNMGNSTYLGYSIEDSCQEQTFVPHSEREEQVYILAKYLHYFTQELDAAWTTVNFDAVTDTTGMKFMLGAFKERKVMSTPQLPSTYVNLGQIGQAEFTKALSQSRVLIGMGNPVISPSPYDALCLGVPFINPIMRWDIENPLDTSRWETQNNWLRDLGPPYVYNVFRGDSEGLVQAVKGAVAHPIDSYVPERMTMSAVENRLAAILETDWYAEALSLPTPWKKKR